MNPFHTIVQRARKSALLQKSPCEQSYTGKPMFVEIKLQVKTLQTKKIQSRSKSTNSLDTQLGP